MSLLDGQIDQIFMIFSFQHRIHDGFITARIPLAAVNVTLGRYFQLFAHQPAQVLGIDGHQRRFQLQFKALGVEGPLVCDGCIDFAGDPREPLGLGR
jgi:hypothetical protein